MIRLLLSIFVFLLLCLLPSAVWAQAESKNLDEATVRAFWEKSWTGNSDDPYGPGEDTWNRSETAAEKGLADRRTQLREKNLISPYQEDQYPARDHACTYVEKKWRTADGSCNDEKTPLAGSVGIRFIRNVKPEFAQAEAGEMLMTPNPRLISRVLLTRKEFKPVPFLNLMATSWIQFMIHDWFDHGEPDPDPNVSHKLYVENDDPWLSMPDVTLPYDSVKNQYYTLIPRTRPDQSIENGSVVPPTPLDGRNLPKGKFKTHQNVVTTWWDFSQIYGSDLNTQLELREGVNGRMKMREDGLLLTKTYAHNGRPALVEMTGFTKNWWLGLSLLHHLFVREHNYIAEQLTNQPETKQKKGESDRDFDERTFQTARLILSAVQAKIHTVEWTPAILANSTMYKAMNGNWYGFNRDRGPAKNWTEQLYRIFDLSGRRGIVGRVGDKANNFDLPASFPEEFVSIYRMHPLLPDQFVVRDWRTGRDLDLIPMAQLRDEEATNLIYSKKYSLAQLMYSVGTEHPGQLVLDNYPKVLQNIKLPVRNLDPADPATFHFGTMDLAAIDIIRDRERGVPRYNEFRRQLHLRPIPDFRYLSSDPEVVQRLREVYNNDVEKLDLFVGAMAESYRPAGFGFSETLFQLFVLIASRRLETDKFFTREGFTKDRYSKWGMEYVNKTQMSEIILRQYPELGNALQGIENPFRPWNQPGVVR